MSASLAKIIDRDRGYRRLLREVEKLAEAGEAHAKVGVLDDGKGQATKDGTAMAVVAAVHEFGSKMRMTGRQAAWMARNLYGVNDENGIEYHVRTRTGRYLVIPERSFMRTAMDEGHDAIAKRAALELRAVIDGKRTIEVALGRMGLAGVSLIQRRMRSGDFTPLSDTTIRVREERSGGKVSDKPLIDTGELLNSIRHEVVMGGGGSRLASAVEVAP